MTVAFRDSQHIARNCNSAMNDKPDWFDVVISDVTHDAISQDRGVPARSTNSTVKITVMDNDDLDPKFTQDIYKAKIYEFYPMPVRL